ncbi:UDP-N-acetylglucosamine 2-epimerase [Pseudoclavibacter albus]|uniref:UDP-N-acetylglucosamine 2-epimerase n=1 Tax=Pseudoclavibacter albus TaxID=272241 RepID=UPI0030B955A3
MTRPKIMIVYGTRPEAIKVAPLIKALASDDRFECVVASTGQHREMLDQVHEMFGITPDVELAIMRAGQTLNGIVSRVIAALDEVFEREQPHAVVVHGDTSTAMAAAIAAFNRGSKVIHLEAGLRTSTLHSPFPEEANRRVISRLASLHLAPTSRAKQHLLAENTPPPRRLW